MSEQRLLMEAGTTSTNMPRARPRYLVILARALKVPEKERRLPNSQTSNSISCAEADLINGCKSHQVAAYEQLYSQHAQRMKSIAMNLLENSHDAEDAVQEAFIKIYRGVGSFKGESTFTAWIYRVLVNSCYDLRRKKQRRKPEVAEMEVDSSMMDTRHPSLPDHPLRLALEQSLQKLDARSRTVFLLFEVEGFKHQEIAQVLQIPEGTSKNLLFEAKKKLRQLLWESRSPERS
jgi:RNA polymerase sigma-70 factor (ECF subfamily)